MTHKTSIRFFEDVPVRAVWDDETAKWWFCAVDIVEALTKSKNPRNYWAKFKSRHNELMTICRRLNSKYWRNMKNFRLQILLQAPFRIWRRHR